MGRKIILLSDGTGNSSAKVWRTNVWRTFEALDLSGSDQVACYDDGVGTSSFKLLAILGGAFGFGLRRNVLTLYKFACRNYRGPDDELFGFGFSRGAFTIRIVMGLIGNQGLIKVDSETELHSLASAAYRAYRKQRYKKLRLERPYQWLRNKFGPVYPPGDKKTDIATIRFIGVWDTVSAYGMPVKEMNDGIHRYLWPIELPDGILNTKVTHAFQALALDEARTTFHPQLWKEEGENPATADVSQHRTIADERITQIWFSGVHSNIGGGYPDDSLAYIPFVWMITQAKRCGLRFKSDYTDILPAWPPSGATIADPDTFKNAVSRRDKDGRLYDPRKGLGGYYRYGPRKLVPHFYPDAKKEESDEVSVGRAKIHESVFRRIGNNAHAYAPIGLPPLYDVVTDDGDILRPDRFVIAPATTPFESNVAAAARAQAQEYVWNEVWKRRAVYFLTVGATLWLLVFPFISDAQRADEFKSAWRWVSDLVRLIGGFLPGFASTWINGYARAPLSFLVMVVVLIGLLYAGARIACSASDMMSLIWRRAPGAPSGLPTDWVYKLRDDPRSKRGLRIWSDAIAPVLSAIAIVYVCAALLSHALFNLQDVAGFTCKETPTTDAIRLNVDQTIILPMEFRTSDLCHASGVLLQGNGARYVITIAPKSAWADAGIPVVPGDAPMKTMPWWKKLMYGLALPLRREFFQDWFKITIRYGSVGGEEAFYDYDPDDAVIRFPLRPTRDGELFIFVNDAVIGLPWLYDQFYRNNSGAAEITLRRSR